MSYSNRELVVFFISYKLSQRNYPCCQLVLEGASGRTEGDEAIANGSLGNNRNGRSNLGMPSSAQGGIEAVKAALRDSVDEFELRYTRAFSDLCSQLHITPATAYHSFESVMDEVFRDGVNWGRVVGLFAFGGALCVECVEKDMSHLVTRIADWMATYLDNHIQPWIQSQGGWVGPFCGDLRQRCSCRRPTVPGELKKMAASWGDAAFRSTGRHSHHEEMPVSGGIGATSTLPPAHINAKSMKIELNSLFT
ncbi:bcl-2-like protein 1 isoform X1 [Oncorhynchus nerka]|uniref:bcl-2-like protein 1 isoform X1 n=1 Tax=Oncorhynchus nerka TaxID=8023 RepID=UPI0031B83CE8